LKDRLIIKAGEFFRALPLIVLLFGTVISIVACGGAEKDKLTKQAAELQEKARALEQELGVRDGQIKKLEEERRDLLGRIPEPHMVTPGESHWQIAFDFLTTKKNLPPEEAGNFLAETVLFDKILVGHRLWNYFGDGSYGTFLTKGEAAVSPGFAQRMEKKNRGEEKQNLMEENSGLRRQAAELERKNAEESGKWKALQDRLQSLNAELAAGKEQERDLESRLNSVYYLVGAKDALKSSGKIKGTFLGLSGDRIKNAAVSDFQKSLDLRNSDAIALTAEEFGLSRIRHVKMLPWDLTEGQDFRIEIAPDGKTAKVHIQDKDKFRQSRILLVLD